MPTSVFRRFTPKRGPYVVLAALEILGACGSETPTGNDSTNGSRPAPLALIEITPSSSTATAVCETVQFTAVANGVFANAKLEGGRPMKVAVSQAYGDRGR